MNEFVFEEFRLDPANALLWRGQDRVALPPKPFEVLCCLVKRAGQLVTKDELLDALWPNRHVTESSLSFSINALRIALGDDPKAPRYIETATRRGYRFIAPVSGAPRMEASRQPEAKAQAPPFRPVSHPRWWVGRPGHLKALDNLIEQAVTGNRPVVFITGEAGIGKTTFVEMVMERLLGRGIGVFSGRCIEHFGTDEAFLPLIEALHDQCRGPGGPHLLGLYTGFVYLTPLLSNDNNRILREDPRGVNLLNFRHLSHLICSATAMARGRLFALEMKSSRSYWRPGLRYLSARKPSLARDLERCAAFHAIMARELVLPLVARW